MINERKSSRTYLLFYRTYCLIKNDFVNID